jgi:hypothetical protein
MAKNPSDPANHQSSGLPRRNNKKMPRLKRRKIDSVYTRKKKIA